MTVLTSTRPAALKQRIEPVIIRILDLLISRPNEPISFEEVSSLIPDASYDHIVETLAALEGPVPNEGNTVSAYIRCCNQNKKAVYID